MEVAQADGHVSQPVDLPGDGIRERCAAKPRRKRLQGIEHGAGEEKHKIKNRGDRVEDVIAPRPQGENRVEKEPARGAHSHPQQEQR